METPSKKKMGRPITNNPKSNFLQIRLTPNEKNMIVSVAKANNITITKLVLQGIELFRKEKEK